MTKPLSLTAKAHQLIKTKLDATALAIDATAGNGHDTVFLAKWSKQVFAFDIQAQAIANTRQRLQQANLLKKVCLFQNGHQMMHELIPSQYHRQIRVIMFNLGYLPGADKQIITQPDTTLKAMDAALSLLQKQGIISLLVYPGHPGGEQEQQSLETWLQSHQQASDIALDIIYATQPHPESPVLYIIHKQRN